MKKIISLSVVILFIFSGCIVNNNTGLIIVQNTSDKAIRDIKIGYFSIGYLAQGQIINLWYYAPFSGNMSADNIDYSQIETSSYKYVNSSSCSLKLDYSYQLLLYCTQSSAGDQYWMLLSRGTKQNASTSDSDFYDYQTP